MKSPEETACELIDDFWNRGPECTRECAQEKVADALRNARLDAIEECARHLEAEEHPFSASLVRELSGGDGGH